jgi:hypothetical protein
VTRAPLFYARIAIAVAGAIVAFGFAACSSATQPECDCIDPSLKVSVAPESAAAVADVRVSGDACSGVAVTCAQQGIGGCASWRFAANAAGTCHIDVLFVAGTTYARDVSIVQSTGCCSGFFPSPVSAGEVDVTPPVSSGSDAGSDSASAEDAAPPEDSAASDAPNDARTTDTGASDARGDV